MPLFRKPAPKLTAEEAQAIELDLERIAGGGIPLGAEQRLKRVAESTQATFNSDLSAKEFAVVQASGFTPIAQVMGSSVVQHGWQNYGWNNYGGGIREMRSFADPWNLSRERSFGRLRQEAQFAGADAVIGIDLRAESFLEGGQVEYAVFGTAVRDAGVVRGDRREPRLCTLSGQDVYKLRRIGAETLDVIGYTACVCVALSYDANRMMTGWWGNSELTEVTQGVYTARHLAMREVTNQARAAGANEMVISGLRHNIQHHEYDSGGFRQNVFIVSMHVLGTAIALGAHEPHPSPLDTPFMSINLGV